MKIVAKLSVFPFFCCICVGVSALAQDIEATVDGKVLNPLARLDTASFTAFVEKPLFSQSRTAPRDPVSVEDTVAAIAPPSLNIRLLGVVVTPQGAVARILDTDDSTSHSLREGQSFHDWTVVSIDSSGLKLGKDDDTIDFTIFKATAPERVVTTAPSLESQSTATADATDTPRVVRVVKTWPGKADEIESKNASKPHSHEQDLIDFFGPNAGKSE